MKNTYKEAMSTITSDKLKVITEEESQKLKKELLNSLVDVF